jgi:hypothetical protein
MANQPKPTVEAQRTIGILGCDGVQALDIVGPADESVGESVGFASSDSFRRAFERRYGIAPSIYRGRFSAAEATYRCPVAFNI